jgi:DNA mismatch endonuclease (patch repair protein)
MSRVRSTGTTPEMRVGEALRAIGVGYRKHVRTLPGTPDFANRTRGWAVLVHGCFWHRHGCKRTTTPVHNAGLWAAKFARNQARDARVEAALAAAGLKVVTIWECETRDRAALQARLAEDLARSPARSDMGGS